MSGNKLSQNSGQDGDSEQNAAETLEKQEPFVNFYSKCDDLDYDLSEECFIKDVGEGEDQELKACKTWMKVQFR